MSAEFKCSEKTHIDEVSRTATSTIQWFLEKANAAGTHPITHNNKLAVFMGGEEGFADIAQHIAKAKESIDLCCWGFDPGMELVRRSGGLWPRGETYGDLLIQAARRRVKVRLLVWFDPVLASVPGAHPPNMPGHTHDTRPWRADGGWIRDNVKKLHAQRSLDLVKAYYKEPLTLAKFMRDPLVSIMRQRHHPSDELQSMLARAEYCSSWYQAAFRGDIKYLEIRTRSFPSDAAANSLDMVDCNLGQFSIERTGLVRAATHHQKPILIDFFRNEGSDAVGYVMGLNSVTDYWDSNDHKPDDPRRECGGRSEQREAVQSQKDKPGQFRTLKPYHDYACRIQGRALVSLYNNFVKAWERAGPKTKRGEKSELGSRGMPMAFLRPAKPGDVTVQIVRTQPEENDTTIRDLSYQALDVATLASRYLYIENQYFQDTAWAKRLMQQRGRVLAAWKAGCANGGKVIRDLPMMHVFIVVPVPEREQMIPRTFETLATLGQQDAMTGQVKEIEKANQTNAAYLPPSFREVVKRANAIEKPGPIVLKEKFGLKIATAMLNCCDVYQGQWRYREIYIHSKLTLVDDVFLMLGSANVNLRSMAVDSEINLATNDPALARSLRKRVWTQHSGGAELCDGGDGSAGSIELAFKNWKDLMNENRRRVLENSSDGRRKKLNGFLLPLEDDRSAFIILG